ncbi:hypothetical protein RFI_16767, partial [Reticulomyxa filosa]
MSRINCIFLFSKCDLFLWNRQTCERCYTTFATYSFCLIDVLPKKVSMLSYVFTKKIRIQTIRNRCREQEMHKFLKEGTARRLVEILWMIEENTNTVPTKRKELEAKEVRKRDKKGEETKEELNSKKVLEWSEDQVSEWFAIIGYPNYCENILTNHITGNDLLELNKTDLQDMGITIMGHIKNILRHVHVLQEANHYRPYLTNGSHRDKDRDRDRDKDTSLCDSKIMPSHPSLQRSSSSTSCHQNELSQTADDHDKPLLITSSIMPPPLLPPPPPHSSVPLASGITTDYQDMINTTTVDTVNSNITNSTNVNVNVNANANANANANIIVNASENPDLQYSNSTSSSLSACSSTFRSEQLDKEPNVTHPLYLIYTTYVYVTYVHTYNTYTNNLFQFLLVLVVEKRMCIRVYSAHTCLF